MPTRRPRSARSPEGSRPSIRLAPSGSSIAPAVGRGVPEDGAIGQEAAYLEFRIDALLEAPEHLQDQPIAEGHRRVALVAPAELGLERALATQSPRSLRRVCRRDGCAARGPRAFARSSRGARPQAERPEARPPSATRHPGSPPSPPRTRARCLRPPACRRVEGRTWQARPGEGDVDECDQRRAIHPLRHVGRGSCPRSSPWRSACPSRRTIACRTRNRGRDRSRRAPRRARPAPRPTFPRT